MPVRPLLLTASTCLSLVLLFSACENETDENRTAILGRWEVRSAMRNHKPTETLAGTFFEFGSNGKMQTNLPVGAETPTEYAVQKNEIVQKTATPVKYHIQSVSDSALTLTLELRGMEFELQMARAETVIEVQDEMGPQPDTMPVDSSQIRE